MDANNALVERYLSRQGREIEKAYRNSVKSKLSYKLRGSLRENFFPNLNYGMHHSNCSGDEEGLIAVFSVMVTHADVVTEVYPSRSHGLKKRRHVHTMDTQLMCYFFGYGGKWKKFADGDDISESPFPRRGNGKDYNGILNIPKRKFHKLDDRKVLKFLELEPSLEKIIGDPTEVEQVKSSESMGPEQHYIM